MQKILLQVVLMKNLTAYIAIIVAMIIWSSSVIATGIGLESFRPLTLVTMRFTLAVALMFVVGRATKSLQRLDKHDIKLFLAAGIIQPFCYYMLETYGLKLLASPTISEVILSTGPLFAPLFAFVLLRERVTWNNIVGIIISTIGVLMLITNTGNFAIASPAGLLLLFGAVFAAVLYTVLLRKIPTKYNSLTIVFYVQAFSLLLFYPAFCIIDLPHCATFAFRWKSFAAVVYLAVFASVAAFVLFCYVVRRIGVTRANAFNNIRPAFTALLMLLLFGEQLTWSKWLGISLVIGGLFICQSSHKLFTFNKLRE